MATQPAFFEAQPIRRIYDEATETWWFSVVDIIKILASQPDTRTAARYWAKLNSGWEKREVNW